MPDVNINQSRDELNQQPQQQQSSGGGNQQWNGVTCKHCGAHVAKTAKSCPNCGADVRPVYKKVWFWLLMIFIVIPMVFYVIGSVGGNKSGSSSSANDKKIEYIDVDMKAMYDELEDNALNAKENYEGKYIRISGYLDNIDSSGKYFSIAQSTESWAWLDGRFQCYIKNEDTMNKIRSASKGDNLTVCGKVKSVGEVSGYSIDVDYIE